MDIRCNTLLEEAIEAWEYARQGVIDEGEGIPEKGWSFPHIRTQGASPTL